MTRVSLSGVLLILLGLLQPTAVRAADWKLVWSDDFHYTGLPDPSKWSYDVGYCRNLEPQYYTAGRLQNARVENGTLIIEARKEALPNPDYIEGSTDFRHARFTRYTSANLVTEGKFDFRYGRLEVVAKIPAGSGVWPAIWTLGTDGSRVGWPACGEIDVMEYFGQDKNFLYSTMHYGSVEKSLSEQGKVQITPPLQGFHTYAVEWSPDRIDSFFDDKKYFTFHVDDAGPGPSNPFRKPHYLLLDLALSVKHKQGPGEVGPIDDARLPVQFVIKSVRVYKDAAAELPPATQPAAQR